MKKRQAQGSWFLALVLAFPVASFGGEDVDSAIVKDLDFFYYMDAVETDQFFRGLSGPDESDAPNVDFEENNDDSASSTK